MIRALLFALAVVLLGGPLAACASLPPPSVESRSFAGRTVVVTGASSGFGRGIALALGARGANVVVAARRAEALESVAAEIRASGGQALVAPTDVSRAEDVARLAQAAEQAFGRVDVWINNAGVVVIGRFDEAPVDDYSRLVDVNLKGVIYGSHEAVRRFRAQGAGVLINIASVEGEIPLPYQAVYSATKHGVVGLDTAIREELRLNGDRGVRVVTVLPWAASTPIWDNAANYTGRRPRAPLLDDPDVIVRAVVAAAHRPRARVAPGWKAKSALAGDQIAEGLTERFAADVFHRVQMERAPPGAPATSGGLHGPSPAAPAVDGGQRERWPAEDAAADPH